MVQLLKVLLCTALVTVLLQPPCSALDYVPAWDLDHPVGSDVPPRSRPLGTISYNPATGEVAYHVAADGRWNLPDLGSKSGTLLNSTLLSPAPYTGLPTFEVGEVFADQLIAESNAIRFGFDRLRYWPWSAESPEILEQYGLEEPPTSYSFGSVLPTGLSRQFLMADLYTHIPVQLLVVPEPNSLTLLVLGCGLAVLLRVRQLAK